MCTFILHWYWHNTSCVNVGKNLKYAQRTRDSTDFSDWPKFLDRNFWPWLIFFSNFSFFSNFFDFFNFFRFFWFFHYVKIAIGKRKWIIWWPNRFALISIWSITPYFRSFALSVVFSAYIGFYDCWTGSARKVDVRQPNG